MAGYPQSVPVPNQPRSVYGPQNVDINQRMQNIARGVNGGSQEQDYLDLARNNITPEQYNQLQQARTEGPGALTRFGRQIGALGTPGAPGEFKYQPVLPPNLQQKLESLYSSGLDRLNQQFAPGQPSAISPILQQARTQFFTQTLPALQNAYTAQGNSLGSSSRIGSLGAAGAGLEENLAALQAQYGLSERNQLMNLLSQRPYEQIYQPGTPNRPGWLSTLADVGLGAASAFIPGAGIAANVARGALGGLSALRQNASPGGYSEQIPAAPMSTAPQRSVLSSLQPDQQDFLNNLSRKAAPGYTLSPQEIQQIQSITGGGVDAGEDFARTFKQPSARPLTYAQRMKQRKSALFQGVQ